jgi:protein-L-isoaspartate(D-aspartate) O-methyltransferase
MNPPQPRPQPKYKRPLNNKTKKVNRFRPSFNTNEELVNHLYNKHIINSEKVVAIMKEINRKDFLDPSKPLINSPQPLQLNQTISAPHIHGKALETLIQSCVPGNRVLDIGCGSGYLLTCFCKLLKVNKNPSSKVVAIDIYSELVDLTINNMKKYNEYLPGHLGGTNPYNNVEIFCGNGWLGHMKHAKYDVIHVGAAPDHVPPQLLKQLNNNGIMIIPVGNSYKIIKKNRKGKVFDSHSLNVRFVPLIEQPSKKKKTDCII